MNKKPNVMLVHGAWADASCWRKVILLLEAKGFEVTAAQIPLTSLADDIAVTRRLVSMRPEPTVLVGHSYGGAVITGAATALPNVKTLVYITAFGLDEGESLESLSKAGPPSPGSASIRPDDQGYLWIDRATFHTSFCGDATREEAAVMAAVQRPLSLASFSGKEATPAWKKLPSFYLICTEDKMIPPPAQELMAKRMGATVSSVPSSHSPFMSQPQAIADMIAQAAETVHAS